MFAGTGVSAGTGNYRLNLPVNTGSGDMRNIGQYWLYDSSAAAVSFGAVDTVSASSVYLMNTGGSVGATVPWTWAVNDEMAITLVYEGA